MDIPLNVDVHCTDGRFGRSTYIVLNPTTEQVTHLVVKEQTAPYTEHLIPISWLKETTPDLILLNRPKVAVWSLEPFHQTDFVQRDVPAYTSDPKLILLWPYTVPTKQIVSETIHKVPPGELAVRRGAKVRATDGRIGQVDEFLIEPESGYITHLVLREGLPWDKKQITIPIWEIERIEEDVVYLKMDKKAVKALPAIPLK